MRTLAITCMVLALGAIGSASLVVSLITLYPEDGVQFLHEVTEESLGTCLGSLPQKFDKTAVTLGWQPTNVTVVIYENPNCQGNSMAIYSNGVYKKQDPQAVHTEDAHFPKHLGDVDLRLVCKFDTCGYSSTAYSKTVCGDCAPDAHAPPVPKSKPCWCRYTWGQSVRSIRVLGRN